MAQEAVVETIMEPPTQEESPLLVCEACNHLVPRTIVCLWCGARIKKGQL